MSDAGSLPPTAPSPTVALWRRTSRALDELASCTPEMVEAALAQLAAEEPDVHREVLALLAADPGSHRHLSQVLASAVGRASAAVAGAESPEGDELPARCGDWQVAELLGRGGMGEVYLARRVGGDFEQQGALKRIRRGLDSDEVMARFLRERQILARLTHPGIARLLDGGVADDGRPYFVLERVEGRPITEYAAASGLGVHATLRLFLRVLDAVEAAHQSFVVHRDLKPSNIFVTPAGDVKLLDFGIAKLLGEEWDEAGLQATRQGVQPLTPAYAAPEQILSGEVSTASDAYSLGVVLYELLVGERPLARRARTPTDLAAEVATETAPLPSEALRQRLRAEGAPRTETSSRPRELAGDLDAILMRALAPEPARRYPTVAAFAADVEALLDGLPVQARGDARGYRLRKFARRHRVALVAASLVAVALIAGLWTTSWQAQRAALALTRAERTQEFLIGLFEEVDPEQIQGSAVTARQLLDRGAEKLEADLTGEPESRGALARTLARTYLGLGVHEVAGHWAAVAETEHRRALGPRDPQTLLSRLAAVEVQVDRGELEGELGKVAELVEDVTAVFGELSREGVRTKSLFAAALEVSGDAAGAAAERRALLPLAERVYGANDLFTAQLVTGLGTAEYHLSHFDLSEAAMRDAIGRFEAGGNGDSPHALATRSALADLLDAQGRYGEALELFADTVARTRRVLGPRHPWLADALLKQGFTLINTRQIAAGRAAFEEAAAILAPLQHFDLGAAWRYLGIADMLEEKYGDAEVRLARAHAWFVTQLGPDHLMVWQTLGTRAQCLVRLDRLAEAEPLLEDTLAALERLVGPDNNVLRAPRKARAELLRKQGHFAEALRLLEQVQAQEAAIFTAGKGGRVVANSHSQVALVYEALYQAGGDRATLQAARRAVDAALALSPAGGDDPGRRGEYLVISGRIARFEGDLARARREFDEAAGLLAASLPAEAPTRLLLQRLQREVRR